MFTSNLGTTTVFLIPFGALILFCEVGGLPRLSDSLKKSSTIVSPSRMFTNAYSIKDANTNTVQEDMKTSIALIYDTGGNDFWDCACCVDRVNNDVTQRVTRAGTASGFIQNEIQDIMTIRHVGMYVWNM